jgi:hypothetical protein
VFYAEDGATHGTIENLSTSGALVTVAGVPSDQSLHIELKLGGDAGLVSARTVRVERTPKRWRIAVEFENIDRAVAASIDAAISSAIRAAQSRPILVVDDRIARRTELVTRLAARGMTPLVARTPLEAIDQLTRTQLHVHVCLLAPSFGQSIAELHALVSESFPWVSTADISDNVEDTVDRALQAWASTDVARLSAAVA